MVKNKKLETKVKEFFKTIGVDGKIKISEDEEIIEVELETEDSGIVIGHHGDTLEALQLILALVLQKELGEFKRVSIEVGDYKKNRSEWLTNLASETKERVLAESREVHLYDLKSWERRVVHLILQNDEEVVSESTGEGKDRVLVVKPKE
ncbi:MAG TPA: R3H domain-containing nucleic acid-binding protein [Patescibacteria group bacterium]|nr:R3H domain-containing nucleic acid-binding protein [Patescibacteria group bacterium]